MVIVVKLEFLKHQRFPWIYSLRLRKCKIIMWKTFNKNQWLGTKFSHYEWYINKILLMFLVRFPICVRAIFFSFFFRGGGGGRQGGCARRCSKVPEDAQRCPYACAFSYSSSRETFSVINSLAFCKSTIPTFLVWRSHIFIVHETFFYRFSYHQN